MFRRTHLVLTIVILAILLLATAAGSLAQKPAQKTPSLVGLAWLTGC